MTDEQLKQLTPQPMRGLTEGRMVHFVLEEGPGFSEHRPAVVVKVINATSGICNLQVFMDGANDQPLAGYPPPNLRWVTSVLHSEHPLPRTWHWIEQA